MNPMFLKDFYKVDHVRQYPKGTNLVYSNFTARKSMLPHVNHVVFFGLKYLVDKYLIEMFNKEFFSRPQDEVVAEYKDFMKLTLGMDSEFSHVRSLHELGYLPIRIRAVKEGSSVPIGVPMLTIENTHPDFYWLTNALETLISSILWGACTSATIASLYRAKLDEYAKQTSPDNLGFVDFQCHDFSFRGMFGVEAASISGAAHLLFFNGSDNIPGILMLEKYYGKLRGTSIPATEHSVMCAGGNETEFETYKRLITEVYPSGLVSIVSDTWDFWRVVGEYLPSLKELIMARDGKVVIRPDSGDPVKILCGDDGSDNPLAKKGLIECLWDIFGGTVNRYGFKELDSHIGAIYGDSITLDRCGRICSGLRDKGFASTNVVYGVGSYTYQYNTRDTLGFAMKATYCEINGNPVEIYKDPKTDDGTKKSMKGLVCVEKDLFTGTLFAKQQCTREEESKSILAVAFENGVSNL